MGMLRVGGGCFFSYLLAFCRETHYILINYNSVFCIFQIDLKKMPLGKLSKRQIESAYKVLNELLGVRI